MAPRMAELSVLRIGPGSGDRRARFHYKTFMRSIERADYKAIRMRAQHRLCWSSTREDSLRSLPHAEGYFTGEMKHAAYRSYRRGSASHHRGTLR